jgi:hypothetical protein
VRSPSGKARVTIGSSVPARAAVLLSALFAAGSFLSSASAQPEPRSAAPVPDAGGSAPARNASPYHPQSVTGSARNYYAAVSGVDALKVRRTGSNLIRFSYRVTDAARAKVLVDRKATPYLIGHRSRAVLQVPVMDKVGPLRQAQSPVVGQEYWMVFSNKGDVVKAGERVSVIIGAFRADGLLVE